MRWIVIFLPPFCVVKVVVEEEEVGSEIDEEEEEGAVKVEIEVMLGRLTISRGFLLLIAFAVVVSSCAVRDFREGRCTEGMLAGLWLRPSFSLISSIAFLFARLRLRLAVSGLIMPGATLEVGVGVKEVDARGVVMLGRVSCERRV